MSKMEYLISGAIKLGFSLNPGQLEQFDSYYRGLIDWNQRLNLTSITDFKEVQLKHFLDSLTITLALKRLSNARLVDVGTGAGLPGLPLKILFPSMSLVLLEATVKKAAFLAHIIERLGLDGVEVVVDRAEEVAHQSQYREKFDVVLSRAVAQLASLVEITLPFCRVGGIFITQKKGAITLEIDRAARAIGLMGGRLLEIKGVNLEGLTDRYLVIIGKVSPTPEKYPRQPGIPAKRPLLDD